MDSLFLFACNDSVGCCEPDAMHYKLYVGIRPVDGCNFDFIKLQNVSDVMLDLTGVGFTDSVDFNRKIYVGIVSATEIH